MKPLYSVLFAILLLAVSPLQAAEKRVALVIGNSAYPTSPLTNPVNDARDIAATLRRLDFTVIEKTDVSQKEMNRAIAQFGEKLTNDTVALFYYAGHGMQVKGKNYLIPVDAQITSEASARAETVDVDTVLDQLGHSPFNIVILDACRNNPFERRFRSTSGGLAQMDAPKGTLIAYATAPGKVASDGSGRNGLYTQELLKNLHTPGLPLEAVFKRVRNGVMQASGDAQTPWESSSLTGDFYFIFTGSATVKAQTPATPTTPATRIKSNAEIEQELWDSIKDSNNLEALNEYLKGYPKGRFVTQAKILLVKLRKEPTPLPPTKTGPAVTPSRTDDAEDALWSEVQKGNSFHEYAVYLDQFPNGKFAALAKARIKKRQEEAAAETNRKEDEDWEAAERSGSESDYRNYLNIWPAGRYAELARTRLRDQAEAAVRQEQAMWKKAESAKNVAEMQVLQSYLDKYPNGDHADEVKARLKVLQNASKLIGSWSTDQYTNNELLWSWSFKSDGSYTRAYSHTSGLLGLIPARSCSQSGHYSVTGNTVNLSGGEGACSNGSPFNFSSESVIWSVSGKQLLFGPTVYNKQ